MSERLIAFFMPESGLRLADEDKDGDEPKLLWKVVLRTGTWKLRPGPGGVKLRQPLKIYRDKAPKGHISMASLVANFNAGAKENVTTPAVHADGTISDSGFVRKLLIQDVAGEDGSGKTQSLLWAGLEITDSEVKRKVEEKSIVGVSGGILFDYEETEGGKKFDQVLSHVMFTNSPWIGKTGGFHDKLPEGVMAGEPEDLPIGEVEFESIEFDVVTSPPGVDPPEPKDKPASGTKVWNPQEGLQFKRDLVQKALRAWRNSLLRPAFGERYCNDLEVPYYHCEDIADGNKALIRAGYESEAEAWVVGFKLDDEGEVEIEPFVNWTPAKQEWVAASMQDSLEQGPRKGSPRKAPVALDETPLRRAQRERDDRTRNGGSGNTTTGGTMRLSELEGLGVELSDEQKAAVVAREQEQAEKDRQLDGLLRDQRKGKSTALLSQLKDTPLDTPGFKKEVESIVTSDDGGTALEFSEETDSGQRTQPINLTATDIVERLIKAMPRDAEGKLTLSAQARNLPDDKKPPDEEEDDKPISLKEARERSEALTAELSEAGLDISISSGGDS